MSQRGRGRGKANFPNNSKQFQFGSSSKSVKNQQDSSYTEALKTPICQPLKKSVIYKVLYLSEKDRRLFGQPNTLAQLYLELDQEFPIINRKTREYYEAILKETNSIKFVHVNLNPGARISEIQFSKAFINGFLSFSDWGVNPNKARILKFYQMEYTYWDYIEAWSKAFLYQNSYHTHSWWIRLDGFKWPSIEDFKIIPH
jgi:hypothetical protein